MKKNLRIVSATAAALLAVAPVAVSTVNSVSADTTNSSATDTETKTLRGTVTLERGVNTQFSVKLTDSQKEQILDLVGAPTDTKPSDMQDIQVIAVSAPNATTGIFKQTIQFQLNGATKTVYVNAKFASQQGVPYFYNKSTNVQLNDGATITFNDIANGFSAQSLLDEINKNYGWTTSDSSVTNAEMTTTASDIESQLNAQGLKRATNGDFDYPANGFNLKLQAKSENGNTASINVRINADVNYNAPAFVLNGNVYYNNNTSYTNGTFSPASTIILNDTDKAKVIVNGKFNNDYLIGKNGVLTVYVQSATKNQPNGFDTTSDDLKHDQQVLNPANIKIDSSKVNASVAGLYPVDITAKNPAGFTSKLTVYVTVLGPTEKAAQAYVKADNTKVYNINGNVVTEDSSVAPLSAGTAVYTFGKVTVDGVEYTRINKEGSNQFVKSSDLSETSATINTEASVTDKVMYKSAVYNKDGKNTGKTIAGYTDTNFVAENGKIKEYTINGEHFYKIANEDGYVRVRNVTGSKMSLKHNAYIYKSNGKRTSLDGSKKISKGTDVTVYGGKYAAIKTKGGKAVAVRVGVNKYIKIGNVNYNLYN